MLPVLTAVTATLGIEPYLLYFGLLSGATLGGNITPIGASANIAAVGMLGKEGYQVSFSEFRRCGQKWQIRSAFCRIMDMNSGNHIANTCLREFLSYTR